MTDDVMPIDGPRFWYKCLICGTATAPLSYSGHGRMRLGVCNKHDCLEARAEQLLAAEERMKLYERAIQCLARMVNDEDTNKRLAELELGAEFYGGEK